LWRANLFGDILSNLGPACCGTIAVAPSANLNPEHEYPSMFEPFHGSAPDIYWQSPLPVFQIDPVLRVAPLTKPRIGIVRFEKFPG
jgi:isocitrate/isopropylmalate dehydrogenase